MFSNHIQCVSYDEGLLCHIIREAAKAPSESTIQNSSQYKYLIEYLGSYKNWNNSKKKSIEAPTKTIIIENDYVDEHYIEDYSLYYSKSFQSIGKKCVRLHFFSADEQSVCKLLKKDYSGDEHTIFGFTKTQLYDLVVKGDFIKLGSFYQGFVVIRPIPNTCFAKLCLAAYGNLDNCEDGRRIIKREIKCNLLGTEFTINGIPMIQQDKMVSECASAAIWTFLCSTGKYSTSNVPSLGNITQKSIFGGSVFPARGLKQEEISGVLHHYGFTPNYIPYLDIDRLKELVLANTLASYSVLLGVKVFSKITSDANQITYKPEGYHLLTITGFQTKQQGNRFTEQNLSGCISAFYIHDDKFGQNFKINLKKIDYINLIVNFTDFDNKENLKSDDIELFDYNLTPALKNSGKGITSNFGNEVFRIDDIFYGVDPQIRSNFSHFNEINPKNIILFAVGKIEEFHNNEKKSNSYLSLLKSHFVFSVSLRKGISHKKRILEKSIIKDKHNTKLFYFYSPYIRVQSDGQVLNLASFLGMNLPKFVWRFRFRTTEINRANKAIRKTTASDESIELDFLYDATALRGKNELIAIVCYTQKANDLIELLKRCFSTNSNNSDLVNYVCNSLNEFNSDEHADLYHSLNDFFSELEQSHTLKSKDNKFGMEKFCARPPKDFEEVKKGKKLVSNTDFTMKYLSSNVNQFIENLYSHFDRPPVEVKSADIFIWLINENGDFLLSNENTETNEGRRGHFSLATYHKARIAGELIVRLNSNANDKQSKYKVEFNSNSSSYSLDFNQFNSAYANDVHLKNKYVLPILQNALNLINPNLELKNLEFEWSKKYYKTTVGIYD